VQKIVAFANVVVTLTVCVVLKVPPPGVIVRAETVGLDGVGIGVGGVGGGGIGVGGGVGVITLSIITPGLRITSPWLLPIVTCASADEARPTNKTNVNAERLIFYLLSYFTVSRIHKLEGLLLEQLCNGQYLLKYSKQEK
jgi:hypothetical protein